jgi:hypothetical protein
MPTYPAAVTRTFSFSDKPLSVYEGNVTIKLPIKTVGPKDYGHPTRGAKFGWEVNLRVQACDEEKCFPPANLPLKLDIEAK